MKAPLWIEIPRWDEFQHYKNRDPIWIRDYVRQLNDPSYLQLTFAQRGLLHDLRLLFAMTRRDIRLDTVSITRRFNKRVTSAHLVSLYEAGLLRIVASKPLAECFPRLEVENKELKAGVEKTGENQHRFNLENVLKDIPRG